MSEPFLAEVRIVGFDFPPRGWAQCDGQILPIAQNQSLYSLIGTTYGGDGRTTFGLPELRGRVPIHRSDGHRLGEKAGERTHTLTDQELPTHSHPLMASNLDGNQQSPSGSVMGRTVGLLYDDSPATLGSNIHPATVGPSGNDPHENTMPYLGLNFVIALTGLFPSRN